MKKVRHYSKNTNSVYVDLAGGIQAFERKDETFR